MRDRRQFFSVLGGAVALSLAARAQQPMRRIGVLMGLAADDPEAQRRVKAFESGWRELGWVNGRNIEVDYHWAPGDLDALRGHAAALVATAPHVILANGTSVLAALREATQSIPIVFVGISDPEGAGVVPSLARPGGHITGFANFEPSMGPKWLQALKELAPNVTRVAVIRNPAGLTNFVRTIGAAATPLGVEVVDCGVRNAEELERAIGAFADTPNVGFIVLPDPIVLALRKLIVDFAARRRIPAIYPLRVFAADGGLLSYGTNVADQARNAAFYIDRILKGTRPADLPVQAPTKFELVINLKAANAIGLQVPPNLIARADEVIE